MLTLTEHRHTFDRGEVKGVLEVMSQSDTSGLASSVVIQRGMGATRILQYGDKLGDKQTEQSISSTSTDKTRNKMEDIRQRTDEMLES
jgi:hypothetical protein